MRTRVHRISHSKKSTLRPKHSAATTHKNKSKKQGDPEAFKKHLDDSDKKQTKRSQKKREKQSTSKSKSQDTKQFNRHNVGKNIDVHI